MASPCPRQELEPELLRSSSHLSPQSVVAGPSHEDPHFLTSPDTLGGRHSGIYTAGSLVHTVRRGFLSHPFWKEGTRAKDVVNSAGRAKEILVKIPETLPPLPGVGGIHLYPLNKAKQIPKQTHLLLLKKTRGTVSCGSPGGVCSPV